MPYAVRIENRVVWGLGRIPHENLLRSVYVVYFQVSIYGSYIDETFITLGKD